MSETLAARPRSWWAGGVAVAGTTGLALLVTGCTSTPDAISGPAAIGGARSVALNGASSAPATPTVKNPVVSLDSGTATKASYRTPVKLVVADGSFASVQVTGDDDQPLDGTMSPDGSSWMSELPPHPASSYKVSAAVKDSTGKDSTRTLTFTVASVPSSSRVAFSVTPNNGRTAGIGQPVVVRFLTPIKERAAYEKVMTVTATAPSGRHVVGAWHWVNSQEVHWRPKAFWTPGTKVKLDMRIAGVKAAPNRYGRRDYSQTFTIGASHITYVDGITHRVKVYRDGTLVNDWPGGTGKAGLETYSGTYIVLGKAPEIVMDSCSARITCDEKDPEYYKEKEFWATRITASGTFLHAASWDGLLGKANVSHGCVHLSDASAEDFFNHAVIGDVVIVRRTGRGPQERIATQDPGLIDWNLSWAQWVAGSALR